MTIPKAIREAAERADALHAQLYGNTGAPAPVEQQQAAPVEPAAVEAPAPAPVEAPAPAPVTADSSWEDKYRVLAGKYAAEVPRYAAEVRELKEQVRRLTENANAAPPAEVSGLTPAEVVERYGDDFASAVAAIVEQRTAQFREEFAPKLEKVAEANAVSARQTFMARISELVPDWQIIDQDPRFTAYLDEVDEMSGQPRRAFFNDADARNDAERIARFFKGFRVATQPQQQAPVEKPQLPSRMGVEYQLAPESGKASDAPPGKRMWTQGDIRQFYADARKGRFSPKDFAAIESDIWAAQRDGRLMA